MEETKIGPHLLGRKVEKDDRDYDMAKALDKLSGTEAPTDDILDKTVRQVIDEGVFFSTWQGILSFWRWVKTFLKNRPTPTPTPKPNQEVIWNLNDFLDQGNTGHCVGFGWTGWLNSAPTEHDFDNTFAHAYYYDCKIIDGEPKAEDGSSVRSGAKVAKNRSEINTYVFSNNLDNIKTWILTQGPIVIGSDWTNDMFNPSANGFVQPTGPVAGGHCYLLLGYSPETDVFTFQNSWGNNWGIGGRFKMLGRDFQSLLNANGEACAGTEIQIV